MIKIFLLASMIHASWFGSIFSSKKSDDIVNQENANLLLDDEYTPVEFDQPLLPIDLENSEPWQKPNYELSKGSLGYDDGGFDIPEGLQTQIDFWKDIYTKYSSWQGVLHDSLYIDNIYEVVDFTSVMTDTSLSEGQRRQRREALVALKRQQVRERLENLQRVEDSSLLMGEDLRYWKMYEKVEDADKFLAASRRGRLRFQLGQSDYFQQGIYYSGRYIRKMTEIFQEEGLPLELIRLVFVESSFNLHARSRVGASGIWQFMRNTGRMYMRVDNIADYRNNPITSTRAAARKLKANYNLTGAWPLAITGYNHGPNGIRRISNALDTKDLGEIIRRHSGGRFGFASRNFYASFMAAVEVEKNANKYFRNPRWMPELKFVEHSLSKATSIRSLVYFFQEHNADFNLYNPQFTNQSIRANILLPRNILVFLPYIEDIDIVAKLEAFEDKHRRDTISAVDQYRVQRGDSLSSIARQFGVTIESLKTHNGLSSSRIYAGQMLNIPQKN